MSISDTGSGSNTDSTGEAITTRSSSSADAVRARLQFKLIGTNKAKRQARKAKGIEEEQEIHSTTAQVGSKVPKEHRLGYSHAHHTLLDKKTTRDLLLEYENLTTKIQKLDSQKETAKRKAARTAIANRQNDIEHILVTHNKRLVNSIVYSQRELPFEFFEDAFQVGCMGLVTAIRKFQPSKYPVQFSTYASYWIFQGIARFKRTLSLVAVPDSKFNTLKIEDPELAQAVIRAKGCMRETDMILDWEVDRESQPLASMLTCPDIPSGEDLAEELKHLFEEALNDTMISPREREVIHARYTGEGKTLNQIGAELKLSKERIRQIEVSAIKKLKQAYGVEEYQNERGISDYQNDLGEAASFSHRSSASL